MAITGLPGVKTSHTATPRDVLVREDAAVWAGKQIILDASASRDYGQDQSSPDDSDILRAGTILVNGGFTAGLYTPWILGVTTVAYASTTTGLSLTVGAGAAKAINKFVGGDGAGTVYITGPPTTNGAVCNSANGYEAVTVSAINETTGVLTISQLTAAYIVGSIITPQDGYDAGGTADYTYAPDCILADRYGVKLTDRDDTDADAPVAKALLGGYVDTAYIVGFPPAASKRFVLWFKDTLHRNMPGLVFDDLL